MDRKLAYAICPLFNFLIREIVKDSKSLEETIQAYETLKEQIDQGFQLLDGVTLRRIHDVDLEKIGSSSIVRSWSGAFSRVSPRTFILELLLEDQDFERIKRKINRILLAFRLYNEHPVYCKVVWIDDNSRPNSFSADLFASPLPDYFGPHPYIIDIDEIEAIAILTEKIAKIDFEKNKSLRIACDRFNRSYDEHVEEDVIIDLCIAFEALFLRGKRTPGNAGQYIGLGCSMLLGTNEDEREYIKKFIRKAYSIRNRIVHGSEIETAIMINAEDYYLDEFIHQLKGYLRESIKKMMPLE